MRIALFSDSYYPRINGVTVSVESYAKKLTEFGHTVAIVVPSYPLPQQKDGLYMEEELDKKQCFTIIRLRSRTLVFSRADRSVLRNQWKVMEHALDSFKPDVIHINTEWVIGGFAVKYAKLRKVPVVFTLHTLWEKYITGYTKVIPPHLVPFIVKTCERKYLNAASQLIVPTELISQVAKRYGATCPITTLPTGIPDMKLEYNETIAKQIKETLFASHPVLNGKQILIYVGRLAKEKNMNFLIDAFEIIKQTHENTVLLIVGGGPIESELHTRAAKSPYSDSIVFTGFVRPETVTYYYSLADVFVFPSKTETQGLVTLEAMRCGIPVVAIGEMGTEDVMQGDHGGFMVKDNLPEFVEKTSLLLDDKQLHDEKAQEALSWGSKWSLQTLTPQLINVYKAAYACTTNFKEV